MTEGTKNVLPALDSDVPLREARSPAAPSRFRPEPTRDTTDTSTGVSFAKRALPKPSALYSTLWRFAAERHRIYLRRITEQPHPWTSNPVLSSYRFTNVFRAADRVSQYLIRMAYSDHEANDDTLFLRTMLFKIFNKIDTWEHITNSMGLPAADRFDYPACGELLAGRRRVGKAIYSAAYIMPSGGASGVPKHRMHLDLLRRMLDDRLPAKLRHSRSLKDAYDLLVAYPTLGPFLAFQYAIDLNYTTLTSHSERSFVVAGPGALDGLSKCFKSPGEYSPEDAILWLSDRQDEEFGRADLRFDGLWGAPCGPSTSRTCCARSRSTPGRPTPKSRAAPGADASSRNSRQPGRCPSLSFHRSGN